jgi:hypothetical protein
MRLPAMLAAMVPTADAAGLTRTSEGEETGETGETDDTVLRDDGSCVPQDSLPIHRLKLE